MMHWSEIVKNILSSKSGDLKELARIAGGDYKDFYAHQSLAGCDLRGQDLREFNLDGCEIAASIVDDKTILDDRYEFRVGEFGGYLEFSIPNDLNNAVIDFAQHYNYVYRAWAYKNLVERFKRLSKRRATSVHAIIVENTYFHDLVLKNSLHKLESIVILLNKNQLSSINRISHIYPQFDPDSYALLSGLISARLAYFRDRSSGQLNFDVLW